MSNLNEAMSARRVARKMKPQDPLIYAAWRRVTYCESQLTDDEFAAYQRWASDTDPRGSEDSNGQP